MRLLTLILAYKDIIILLFIGLAFRLYRLEELMTVGGDQGYDLMRIKEILEGNPTLLGPPIGHFANTVVYLGPLYYYLTAPFVAIFNLDPIGLAIPTIIGRLAATIFIYFVAKKLFNQQVGIIAAIISVLSPYFTKSLGPSSPPYLIPLVAILVIFTLTTNKRSKGGRQFLVQFGLLGFLSGVTTSLHYLGLSLFLALIIYLFYGIKRNRLGAAISLIFGFFLAISPTVLFELRNDFFLTKQLIFQLSSGAISPQGQSIASQFVHSFNFLTEGTIGFSPPFMIFLFLFIAAILVMAKTQIISKVPMLFMLSIVVINLVLASLYGQKVQSHYLAASYVPLFIFSGVLISETLRFSRRLPPVLIVVVSVLLILQNDLGRSNGYTMPEDLTLRQIRQISKIITDDVGGQSFNITSTLDGDSRALPYRYLADVYGKQPLDVQTYDKGDSLYVITRDPTSSVRQNSLFEIASFQPSSVSKSWNINGDIKLIKLSKASSRHSDPERFVTIVNPVRSRDLWQDRSITNLTMQIAATSSRALSSTWLLTYDTLDDTEIVNTFKNSNYNLELGAFLEVGEKWATDAGVSYKIGEGDYYRPDKIFLSGYDPQDREKLIKTYIKKYQKVFDVKPQVAGAWYVDARSQNYLAREGIKALLVVADQYNTDAQASWGKYWSMPFYPSKYNSLEPAISQRLKIPIVNLQWAQRHPIFGYGKSIENSRHSFQANDYINNGFDSQYFNSLLSIYLGQQKTDFVQITLGLEAGQEAKTFSKEFNRQLDLIKNLKDRNELKVVTMGQFSNWYQNTYPGISPSHFLTHESSFWYMSPKFRAFITEDKGEYQIRDLRYYQQTPQKDYLYADHNSFLDRKVSPQVEGLDGQTINLGNLQNLEMVENFDRLTLKTDNDTIQINTTGVMKNGQYLKKTSLEISTFDFQFANFYTAAKVPAINVLQTIRFSNIESQAVFGLKIGKGTLIGLKSARPGLYKFPFQTLVKFKSPAVFLNKYQPWTN